MFGHIEPRAPTETTSLCPGRMNEVNVHDERVLPGNEFIFIAAISPKNHKVSSKYLSLTECALARTINVLTFTQLLFWSSA